MKGTQTISKKYDTKSIRYDNINQQWRSNPKDPTFYISFSIEHLISAYGSDGVVQFAIDHNQLKNLNKEIIRIYKEAILREYRDKVGLPLKILPKESAADAIAEKNVIFILAKNILKVEGGYMQGVTLPFTFPFNPEMDQAAHFKIIMMDLIQPQELTNKDIYNILHEMGHAFTLKHSRPYLESDNPPFDNSLTCLDTIMNYKDACPPVLIKEKELLGARTVSIFDPDPKAQAIVKTIYSQFPVQLGDLDVQALKQFKKNWEAENKKQKKQKQNHQRSHAADLYIQPSYLGNQGQEFFNLSAMPHYTAHCFFDFLDSCFDSMIADLTEKIKDVISHCPSYFPPGQAQYWSNHHLFQPHPNQTMTPVGGAGLPGYANLPKLGT